MRQVPTFTYVEIAHEAYRQFAAHRADVERLRTEQVALPSDSEEWIKSREAEQEASAASFRQGIVVVLFTAMAVESCINEYGSRKLAGKLFDEHVDKLSIVGKWRVVPRLVTGKEIDHGSNAMGVLTQLVKWRNELAHPKSVNLPTPEAQTRAHEKYTEFMEFIPRAITVGELLACEVRKIVSDDGTFPNSLLPF